MIPSAEKICPRCQSPAMRSWHDLDDEQKMLAEKLPLSARYASSDRKKHRFCTRCWFEDADRGSSNA